VLQVDQVTRRFGEYVVLDEVSFELAEGGGLALVGPNGCGKTTLLRCVVGADHPDEGRVTLDGFPMAETDPVTRAALACVLDDIEFFPDLSVLEHLDLLARAHGVAAENDEVATVLAELDLTGAADQLPVTLSSGQRRRLALASCLVRPRRLLVLDEPEQRLDVAGRDWLAARLRAEREAGVAILLASHDPDLVTAVADHILELG
jgi:heme ABC exporter ATP-binding subunit CcmA